MKFIDRSWRAALLVAGAALLFYVALLSAATPERARVTPTVSTLAPPAPLPVEAAALATALPPIPTETTIPTKTPIPTETTIPTDLPTATPAGPTVIPTPTPRPPDTPWRVGLQVGHWNSHELPDELARLRTSTGARYGSLTEAELNLEIAQRVQALLEAQGVLVDLLPATVPPAYDADAFLAIHADGSPGGQARGWKLATPWRASPASRQLLAAVAASYGPATGLPEDRNGVTVNMRGYYAFSYRRHTHAIARTTPAIIVEMGFMTSAADRAVLLGQPDRVAIGIAEGVLNYLRTRDPNDGAALLPPEYPVLRAVAAGATLRAAPSDSARVVQTITPDQRILPLDKRDGWYEVVVRGEWRAIGWVREDQVEATDEPLLLPTPSNP